ncbi:Nmad5 family putative nucleotide modification protein [Xenorhabdus sp. XENO-10]|uniref:Nmad5 family putative nucleotide modification protein n=1 Tax=Xenorhabdus yunnanensis TaxID=3025878 RepID=A0ABT5LF11_9GAMM|nr:Nmad5 family putative nucleotide modification protein [Xenorhabdus yunnanensis]MDC9589690.1 Nmad5 family putative nucleotide modification protein [Xenorhabdus yunnanensis]
MTQKTLTKAVKEEIVKNALTKAGIFEKEEQLYKDRADWAEKVRIEAIGGENMDSGINDIISEIKTLANKIPESMRLDEFPVREYSFIEINLAGSRVIAYFNGARERYYDKREYIYKITPRMTTLLADNPLVNEFYELEKRHEELNNQREDITNKVESALLKVRSVKRLLAEWPEAAELLPKDTTKAAPVPAVRREALNALIGLPTEADNG